MSLDAELIGPAGPSSRRPGRRSGRADAETQVIIVTEDASQPPVRRRLRGEQIYGTPHPALGWSSPAVLTMTALGVAGLAAFLARERTAASPMLPLAIFQERQFARPTRSRLASFTPR